MVKRQGWRRKKTRVSKLKAVVNAVVKIARAKKIFKPASAADLAKATRAIRKIQTIRNVRHPFALLKNKAWVRSQTSGRWIKRKRWSVQRNGQPYNCSTRRVRYYYNGIPKARYSSGDGAYFQRNCQTDNGLTACAYYTKCTIDRN